MLERAFGKKRAHEERTVEAIRSDSTRVGRILNEAGVDRESVAQIIEKTFPIKFVTDILSSQLDADRMDYLLRDSYCTGVAYGEYDVNWLFLALCLGSPWGGIDQRGEEDSREECGQLKLCLDKSKGVYAAERFIMARLHMYQQVYMHRVTRGYEVLLLNLFNAARHAAKEDCLPVETPDIVTRYCKTSGDVDLAEFLGLDESQMLAAIHVWAQCDGEQRDTIRTLSQAFLNRERIYRAVDLSSIHDEQYVELRIALREAPKEADDHTATYGIDTVEDVPYEGMLYSARRAQANRFNESLEKVIWVSDVKGDSRAEPVELHSRVLREIDGEKMTIRRLYYRDNRAGEYRKIMNGLGLEKCV
jgi:hypothetical protein